MPQPIVVSDEGESFVFFTRRPHAEAMADAWRALGPVARLRNVRVTTADGVCHKVRSPDQLLDLDVVTVQTRWNQVWMSAPRPLTLRNGETHPGVEGNADGVWAASPKGLTYAPVELSYDNDGCLRIRFTWVGVFSDPTQPEGQRWATAQAQLERAGFALQGSKR